MDTGVFGIADWGGELRVESRERETACTGASVLRRSHKERTEFCAVLLVSATVWDCLGVFSGGNVLSNRRERLVVCLPVVAKRQRGQLIACSNASCLAWIARCMSGGLSRMIESSRDIWVMA